MPYISKSLVLRFLEFLMTMFLFGKVFGWEDILLQSFQNKSSHNAYPSPSIHLEIPLPSQLHQFVIKAHMPTDGQDLAWVVQAGNTAPTIWIYGESIRGVSYQPKNHTKTRRNDSDLTGVWTLNSSLSVKTVPSQVWFPLQTRNKKKTQPPKTPCPFVRSWHWESLYLHHSCQFFFSWVRHWTCLKEKVSHQKPKPSWPWSSSCKSEATFSQGLRS